LQFRAWPNLRVRGVDWPLFAVFGGIATGLIWFVVVIQSPGPRYAGLGWLVVGFATYYVYRRRIVHEPLTRTVRAPIAMGRALALEYRNVLVPVIDRHDSEAAVDLACRLATERGASIVALTVLEIPLELPIDAELPEGVEQRANDLLDEVRAIGDAYGVNVIGRIARARRPGPAIVDEATSRHSEIIVLGSPRRAAARGLHGKIFGATVDYVLKNAPCRVLVAAARKAA